MGTNISMTVRSLIFIILTMVLLFIISWELTVVVLIGILPMLGFAYIIAKKTKINTKLQQDARAKLSSMQEEAMANVRTVKAFSCEQHETDKHRELN